MRPLFLLFLLFSSLCTQAQLVLKDVDACIQYAQEHNLLLQSAQQQAKAAAEAKNIQRAALLPQLKAVSTLDYHFSLPVQLIPAEILGGEPGTFREVSFGQPYVLNLGAEASMPLLNTSLWLGTKLAATEAERALLQLEQSRLSTAEAIAKAYFFTLLSSEAVKLAQNTKAANDSLLAQALQKQQNGIMEPLELNRIKGLQLESARLLEENKAAFTNNMNHLKLLLGLQPQEQLLLTEQLAPDEEKEPLSLSYSFSTLPEYLLGEAKVQSAKLHWQQQRSKWLPELSAYARYNRQAQRNTFNFTESHQPWFNMGTAGLRLEWPIFTGFRQLASTRQTHLQYQAASLEMQHTSRKLQQEQEALQLNYLQSRQSLHFVREAYRLGNQNYQLAGLKYAAGILPLDQLIGVYHEKLRAQNGLLKALADHLYYHSLISIRNTPQP